MSIDKANRLLGIIRRSFCALDKTSFPLLYKAIVRPHLEYAATIWNPYKEGYIDNLETVQHRATKLLENISHLSYPERLAAINLLTLVYRHIRGDMIKAFKIIINIYNSRVTNFLSKSSFSTTKGHNFKLQHANFIIRKWLFSICIVDIWNCLPSNIVNASNVMCFEKRLDKCWADLKIKFDNEAPLNYSEFKYTKTSKSQNIDFDGELSVEANTI